ncbi:hypothetical protein LIER_40287 [Lithospermum erythrorhizon]|uniref:Uncharacterized protein n=1 Tax=Lithospermum erythrorhizon TaxID=34254 RepID=A0AAV3QTE6_LITER
MDVLCPQSICQWTIRGSLPLGLLAPSTYNNQILCRESSIRSINSGVSSPGPWVFSTIKSASACALMLFQDLYRRSNSLSSMAHLTIRPDRLGFSRIYRSGWSMMTSTGCASKYSLSFREATMRAYTNFSVKGYLV